MRTMPTFELKQFFNSPAASAARANLSPSFAEPLAMSWLLSLEPDAAEALTSLPLGYTAAFGGTALREAIARQYTHLEPEHIITACGADDALSALCMALLQPGDHVIVHNPVYQPLASITGWCGAEVTPWEAREEHGWRPSLDDLHRLLRPATRMVVVNVPHSPTGYAPDSAFLEGLVALTADAGCLLLGDEIYRGLPLQGYSEPLSLADLSEHAIVLNSVSKSYGLPGLRAGWLATRNAALLDTVRAFRTHQNTFLGAPVEFLAALALRHAEQVLARNRALAQANVAVLDAFLARQSDLFACVRPNAGVVAYPRWLGPESTTALSARLLQDHGLLLAPSAYFSGGDRHVRLGFGTAGFAAALALLEAAL